MTKPNRERGGSSRGRSGASRGRDGQVGRGSQRGGRWFSVGQLKSGQQPHQQRKKQQNQQEKEEQQQQQQRAQPQRDNKKPPRFPNFRGPADRFVEDSDPQFADIVSKCYGGFCVEGPETFDAKVLHPSMNCAQRTVSTDTPHRTGASSPVVPNRCCRVDSDMHVRERIWLRVHTSTHRRAGMCVPEV